MFFLIFYNVNRVGRRRSNGGALLLCAVACLGCALVQITNPGVCMCMCVSVCVCVVFSFLITAHSDGLKLFLSTLGKFAIAANFSIIYVYSAELFPTELR